ncbi:MAG: putative PEP-binding protein [Methanobacteriota archaeon]
MTLKNVQGEGEDAQVRQGYSTFPATVNLHMAPAFTLFTIFKEFRDRDGQNRIQIPNSTDEEGNADPGSGWQDLSITRITNLHIERGGTMAFRVEGPDTQLMQEVLHVLFHDDVGRDTRSGGVKVVEGVERTPEFYFQAAVADPHPPWYDECLRRSGLSPAEEAPVKFTDLPLTEDVASHPMVVSSVDLVATGPGTLSGMAAYGLASLVLHHDYTRQLALVDPDQVDFECRRLAALRKVLTEGRPHMMRVLDDEASGDRSLSDMVSGETAWFKEIITRAEQTVRGDVSQQRLDDFGVQLSVSEDRCHPNAELAIELLRIRPEQEHLKARMMRSLAQGLTVSDTIAYILHRLVDPEAGGGHFRRAGLFHLVEDEEGRHLQALCEWKQDGLRECGPQMRIPLVAQGVGVAYVARRALEEGVRDEEIFSQGGGDPRVNQGYMESQQFVMIPVFSDNGVFQGVIWADNMDQEGISAESIEYLRGVTSEAGELLQMSGEIRRESRPTHEGEIAVLGRIPLPEDIRDLAEWGYVGYVTPVGTSTDHSAMYAGSRRMPAVLGVGRDFLQAIRPGDPLLLIDTADNRPATLVVKPIDGTLGFIGCTSLGQVVPIEPEISEIRDAKTTDNHRVHLMGVLNGDRPDQLSRFGGYGAEGMGLGRPEIIMVHHRPNVSLEGFEPIGSVEEFLALMREDNPHPLKDLTQYFATMFGRVFHAIYENAHEGYQDEPAIVRYTDLNKKKLPDVYKSRITADELESQELSGLGLLIAHPDILLPQQAGLCIAARDAKQPVGFMMPNVRSVDDVAHCSESFDAIATEYPPGKYVQKYAQIECPAAIYLMPEMAKLVDGFGVGLNDLASLSSGLPRGARPHLEFHPLVAQHVLTALTNARREGKECIFCGGDSSPELTILILGLSHKAGNQSTRIALPARMIPQSRDIVCSVSAAECGIWADKALQIQTSGDVYDEVYEQLARNLREKLT